MKQIASVKIGQFAAKYGEHAPAATACCNACRTCVTSNALTLAAAAGLAAWTPLARLGRRVAGR